MECLLSIIIPVYNDAEYLGHTLDSIIMQKFKKMEIICVDDASTDESLNIIKEYKKRDTRIKYISFAENRSALQARKIAVESAIGRYIMFVDGDDFLEPYACEELVEFMEHKNVDILEFGTFLDIKGNEDIKTVQWLQQFLTPCDEDLEGDAILKNTFNKHKVNWLLWNKIFKAQVCKEAFARIELDHKLYRFNDLYAFFLIALQAHNLTAIEKKYYHYNFSFGYGSSIDFSSKKFQKEAPGAAKVLNSVQESLNNANKLPQMAYVMDFLEQEIAEFYIWRLHSIDDKDDIARALDIFLKYFNSKLVAKLITSMKEQVNYYQNDVQIKDRDLQLVLGKLNKANRETKDLNNKLYKVRSYLYMNDIKLLTVIVPVYGTEQYLKKCLDSIINSSYLNIEIIVVDDGSPGDVQSIIDTYFSAPMRGRCIKLIRHEANKGLYHARLTGVENAAGEYIAFLDSDDSVSCDFYRKLIVKQQQTDSDIVLGEFLLEDVDGNKHYHNLAHVRLLDLDLHGKECIEFLLKQHGLDYSLHVVWNKIYKRSLWEKALPYLQKQDKHLIMCEDIVFSIILFFFSERITNVHDAYVYYFQSEDASTSIKKANFKKYKKNINDISTTFSFVDNFFKNNETKYRINILTWFNLIKNIWHDIVNNSQIKKEEKDILLHELNFTEDNHIETHKHDNFFYSMYTYTQDKGELLKRKILAPDVIAVSFDIFDTLIVRPFFDPTDIFSLMEQYVTQLLKGGDYFDFKAAREYAEYSARHELKNTNKEEITLEDIYAKLSEQTGISSDVLELVKQKEITLELNYCKSRNYTKELYDLALAQGKQVIITSDMYLPKAVIEKILQKNGFIDYYKLYLSSDIGLTKHSGNLYKYIVKDLGLRPAQILHIGDNARSDVEMAQAEGFQAMQIYKTTDQLKNNIEHMYYGESFNSIFNKTMTTRGAQQYNCFLGLRTMLAMVANKIYDNPFVDFLHDTDFNADPFVIGYYPLGMHMFSVAKWLQDECALKKYDNLNFFARDGYLPMQALSILSSASQLKTKLNYIPLTRASILPFQINSAGDFNTLIHNINITQQSPKSIIEIFSRFMTEKQLAKAEKCCQDAGFDYDKLFGTKNDFLKFRTFFVEEFYNKDQFVEYKEKMRCYFDKYFDGKSATFDVGYSCRAESALRGYYGYDITPYYIHINNDVPFIRSKYRNFQYNTFFNYSPAVTGILRELLISAQTPSCKAIIPQENGEVIFEYADEQFSYIEKYIMDIIQKAALKFITDMKSTFGDDLDMLYFQREDASLPHEYLNSCPKYQDMLVFKTFEFEDKLGLGKTFNMVDFWHSQVNNYLKNNLFNNKNEGFITMNDYTLSFVQPLWLRTFCLYFVNRDFLKGKVKERLQNRPLALKCLQNSYKAVRYVYRWCKGKK